MLVFISISSSISVSLCRDDVIITVEFGVTRQAEWAVPNGLQHPPRRRWATTSGEGLKGWIDSTYGHISGSSPNSRKIDSPNSRKIGDVKKLWIFYLPIGIFLEGKETMRRELENWYGTKESWIKWCHFNVRLPCDCKKLFVNYPATAYLPAHNYTWLPDDYLTGPDLLHFEALLELQVVRSYTPWVAQRSHRHLAIQSWSWRHCFAYVCLGPFERMRGITSSYYIIFLTFRFHLSAGWIGFNNDFFGIRMVEFPAATSKLYPRILNNVIFRRSPDLSRIHHPAHGTFCPIFGGF